MYNIDEFKLLTYHDDYVFVRMTGRCKERRRERESK